METKEILPLTPPSEILPLTLPTEILHTNYWQTEKSQWSSKVSYLRFTKWPPMGFWHVEGICMRYIRFSWRRSSQARRPALRVFSKTLRWQIGRSLASRLIPIDMNTIGVPPRATTQVLTGTGISGPPIRIRGQEVGSPRGSIGPQKARNAHLFKTSINVFSPKHGHPTPIFSKAIGCKTFSKESADVNSCYGMDFGRNSDVIKSPNFMEFGLWPAKTPDKIESVIVPTTRVGRLANGPNRIRTRHDIEEVTADRVGGTKSHIDYILKSDFETMRKIQDFERGNISMSRPTLDSTNIYMSRPNLDSTPNVFNTNNGTTSPID